MAKAKSEGNTGTTYNVAWLAEQLDIAPVNVRGRLRRAGIEKDGRSYVFPNKKAATEVLKQIEGMADKPKKETKGKGKSKPAAKKRSRKKAADEDAED